MARELSLRGPDGSLTSPKAPIMQIVVPLLFIFLLCQALFMVI